MTNNTLLKDPTTGTDLLRIYARDSACKKCFFHTTPHPQFLPCTKGEFWCVKKVFGKGKFFHFVKAF